MKFREFLTSIGFGSMKVDTVVERPHLDEGETLNGTIYFHGGDEEQDIEFVELKVIKLVEEYREDSDFGYIETVVGKQSIEFAGAVKSKESVMRQFEIVPDERWLFDSDRTKLILRTIVHIDNGINVQDEDEITYGKQEGLF
ncbi:sporulation protein [Planococcus sp. N028]|uniref:Sporulation protein n=1 Tax=Planococcus shixiaomingii TaxID=3058393 RepID=A0ABT8MZF9_9BACL|nr:MULTISPECIES: sporulation protein [unclassified Planococcus (in: firmicutes)]MDN7240999.1 sporulation protein [Planococcus sp. N028]WKA53253.1 sporulation protein [Planococcus sp. N022]